VNEAEVPEDLTSGLESITATLSAAAQKEIDRELRAAQIANDQNAFWKVEDSVYARVPRYAEVESQYRTLAEATYRSRGLTPVDVTAVRDFARAELDVFWDKGSLSSPEGYGHAYLARAVLEIAVEKNPEDFWLLSDLKEAISSASPFWFADKRPSFNPQAYEELWPIVDKQKKLVDAGKVPLSPQAMLAMYDWVSLVGPATGNPKAAVDGWQWLVDNADTGGWGKMKELFGRGLSVAKEGSPFNTNLYAYPGDLVNGMLDTSEITKHARRLESLKGSRKYREKAVPVWEKYDELSH
jgi:hypothetical protein